MKRDTLKTTQGRYGKAFVIALALLGSASVPVNASSESRSEAAKLRDQIENDSGPGRMSSSDLRAIANQKAIARALQLQHTRQRSRNQRSGTGKQSAALSRQGRHSGDSPKSGFDGSTVLIASPEGTLQLSGSGRTASVPGVNMPPTWESRPIYTLSFPAPRGQIVDRNGEPLALTRLCVNVGINFPTPLDMTPAAAIAFARAQITKVQRFTRRRISIDDQVISRLYINRGFLPLDIARDLTAPEQKIIKAMGGPGLILHPTYVRSYPNGALAAHTLGFVGRAGPALDGPIQFNDLLWSEVEGREGLEQTFNEQLTGKQGQVIYTFDEHGKKLAEKINLPAEPGQTVVTTLDLKLQRLCEKTLAGGCRRGAMVFMDPNSGDILAMASCPTFDPNVFIPAITPKQFKALNDNPNLPMLPRAFRSAYPPGSTFKIFVGLAALQSRTIALGEQFSGPGAMQVDNIVMHNWKSSNSGMLTFEEALVESCDTWFYQVGLKTGATPIIDWALKFGFAAKTGIPLRFEAEGSLPTDDYLAKRNLTKLSSVDIANISIGQGDVLVTPLQMAQAMATIANGGKFHQTRLVQHVQDPTGKIIAGYDPKVRDDIALSPTNLLVLKEAMLDIVRSKRGTAPAAAVEGIDVAGKTGTAEWGPKAAGRNAAWFAGFAPANKPKYAFVALYETDPGQRGAHGGVVAAPLIGKVLREAFKLGLPNAMVAKSSP